MRKVKINDAKVRVFQERDLIEKLGRTKEEWKLVKKYQKKFYQLLRETDGFAVDTRMLWNELNNPTGEFGKWIRRKVVNKKIREDGNKKKEIVLYEENKDYISDDKVVVRENGATRTTDYFLTVDCAKNICLMEETTSAQAVRDYFILMEKCIREYENWTVIREPQKKGNNVMKDTIQDTYISQNGKKPDFRVYCNENDMLNVSLTEMKAKQLQNYLDMGDKNTREHLTAKVNQALAQLQFINTSLISSGMSFNDRKKIIKDTVRINYADIRKEIDKIKKIKVS